MINMLADVIFSTVMRGYDRRVVDAVVRDVRVAIDACDRMAMAHLRQMIITGALPVRIRGYDQGQVDDWLREAEMYLLG